MFVKKFKINEYYVLLYFQSMCCHSSLREISVAFTRKRFSWHVHLIPGQKLCPSCKVSIQKINEKEDSEENSDKSNSNGDNNGDKYK